MRVAKPTRLARMLSTLLVAGGLALGSPALPGALASDVTAGHEKVVVIVGPVGSLTDTYRALADKAVAAARRQTDNVVTVYSPQATWPAVRRALQGASIVVYLGHGNGWPSPYRDALFPPTQDGLGLNPVAGVDDTAHQYFGEAWLARYVRLAPGAVILLHRLCYASGAGEPGMPNPPPDVAFQRVDNFAAGWLATGASAVVAEGHLGPGYYVNALLADHRSSEAAWRASPSSHGHVQGSPSVRTPGAAILLDPDTVDGGYYRSLVLRGAAVPPAPSSSGAGGERGGPQAPDSLVVVGSRPVRIDVGGATTAGSNIGVDLVFDGHTAARLPKGLVVGAAWTWLDADGALVTDPPGPGGDAATATPATPAATATPATPAATATPRAAPSTSPGVVGSPPPGPPGSAIDPSPGIDPPPQIDLVAPESQDGLVVTRTTSGTGRTRKLTIDVPPRPGLYRLVLTVHDPDGVAYDAATQRLVRPLIVHVTGRTWATFAAPDQLTATSGGVLVFGLRVGNTGAQPWGLAPTVPAAGSQSDRTTRSLLGRRHDPEFASAPPSVPGPAPRVVVRWLALGDQPEGAGPADPAAVVVPLTFLMPGGSMVVPVSIPAPTASGQYLLFLDLVTADGTSLTAAGVPPGLIRVLVTDPPPRVTGGVGLP